MTKGEDEARKEREADLARVEAEEAAVRAKRRRDLDDAINPATGRKKKSG